MNKIEDAREILKALGLPLAQQNEMSALTLLALCGIRKQDKWKDAKGKSLGVSKGIMSFVNNEYGKSYAPNTRETFRRQVLHQFVQAQIADYNPDNAELLVNSPNAHYAILQSALKAIENYKTKNWKKGVENFIADFGELSKAYSKLKESLLIPVTLSDGTKLKLSAGRHNKLQAAVIKEFAPRFAKEAQVLYLGDTAKKDLYRDDQKLKSIGIPIDQHSKLPDIVIYDPKKNWLFLIEAVTSHGPVSPKRVIELEAFLKNCQASKIYVTAFPDKAEFRKHIASIAWETEVWLVDAPDHLIHFNGDKFMGPHN